MSVTRGFYRHYKGHCYYVHGVACLKHENDRRVVVYASVKTEESGEGFDFLARSEAEFEQWVHPATGGVMPHAHMEELVRRGAQPPDWTPRFARVTDPERSKLEG